MSWKPWIVGAAALVVFDTLLVLGVRSYRSMQRPELPSPGRRADILSAPVVSSRAVPPAPKPLQTACVAGVLWVYDDRSQRWFRPGTEVRHLSCTMRDVRDQLRHDGATVAYPKPSA
jgi:hypothetical protein